MLPLTRTVETIGVIDAVYVDHVDVASVVRPSAMTVVMRAGRPCRWRWRGFVDSA